MIRNIVLSAIFVSIYPLAHAQIAADVKLFIERSFEFIDSNTINTQNIDSIKNWLYTNSANSNSVDEVAPLYTEVFKRLNDHHGNLQYKDKTYGWKVPLKNANAYIKKRLTEEKSVMSMVLKGEYGYLRIPGNTDYAFKKVDSIASDIVDHINKINSPNIKGWIIDLRCNTGGNMYPMMLGLKDFIGDEVVFGGFQNAKGKPTGKWEIVSGNMLIDGIYLQRTSHLNRSIPSTVPLAILTSSYTASAGEMTAISLIGRPHTIVIGETTANYITAVQGFKINVNAAINLSTDYVVDRNKKVYTNSIVPDREVIGGDNFDEMLKDEKINMALNILEKKEFYDN